MGYNILKITLIKMTLSEQLTYSTARLICIDKQGNKSLGTGFIMHLCQHEDKSVPVIITNYHVVDGCSKIEFEFCLKTPNVF